jgi:predicted nucleic acid-binding protein
MPNVVSNATPIISLLKLSRLDILQELYSEISIPFAVFQEIEEGKNKFSKSVITIQVIYTCFYRGIHVH